MSGKKDCPTIQEICWCLLTQNQKHSTVCFPPMIWYDMIAFLMFLCRFAVSVAGKCTRDDSIQLEISPVAATTLMMKNWSPSSKSSKGPKVPKSECHRNPTHPPGGSPSSPDFPVVARTLLGQSQGDCHLLELNPGDRSFSVVRLCHFTPNLQNHRTSIRKRLTVLACSDPCTLIIFDSWLGKWQFTCKKDASTSSCWNLYIQVVSQRRVLAVSSQPPGALKQQRNIDEDHHSSTSQEGIKSSQFEHWFLPSWSMWTYYDLLTKLEKKGTETLCLKTPSDFGLLPLFSPEFLDVCSLPKCTGLGFGKLIWGMKSMLPRRCWFAMHGTRFATCHPFLSMSTIGKCVLST